MKTASPLILGVLGVAVGLLLVDRLLRDAPEPAPAPTDVASNSSPYRDGGARLEGGVLPEVLRRLDALEGRQAMLERELGAIREAFPASGTVDLTALRRLVPPAEADLDENALDALQVHLDALQRRAREVHARGLVQRNIARLDLRLSDDANDRVTRAVLAYQARAATFWTDVVDRGITDRREQLEELKKVQEAFRVEISAFVPEGDLDRAVDGLIGRASLLRQPDGPSPSGPVAPGGYGDRPR